jgi:hypothetical protein
MFSFRNYRNIVAMATSHVRPFQINFPGLSAVLHTSSTVCTFITKTKILFFSKCSRTRVGHYIEMDFSYFAIPYLRFCTSHWPIYPFITDINLLQRIRFVTKLTTLLTIKHCFSL